jgi:2-octaprenylphenol hydroxylase
MVRYWPNSGLEEISQMTETSNVMHDVVIVGGGLVGGLCALLLAEGGIAPVVLDAAPAVDDGVLAQRDARVFALSPANLHVLQRVGVWARVRRHAPYQAMHVWHRDGYGQLDFGQADALYAEWLGSMVEPSVLALALQEQTVAAGLDWRRDTRVVSLEQYPDHWQIRLQDGQVLCTRLLIGADGGRSMVRQAAGILTKQLDYQQSALTCAIRTDLPHAGVARQVFLAGGPLAFLPMADLDDAESGYWQSVVWSLPTDIAAEMSALDDTALMAALTEASERVLGNVQRIESRGLFPLRAQQAEHDVAERLALIGDAAHVVHPMAGQGVNLGLLDAAVLADALLHDRARGLWAHRQTLARYARTRRLPNSLMMHGLSALGWIQGAQHPALVWLRGEGMHQLSRLPQLRQIMTAQAGGHAGLKHTRYAAQ